MARVKHSYVKSKLAKYGKQTKWAPFWLIPKIFGVGRRIHPGRITTVKRSWRRTNIKKI